jgi:NADPH2:quinone reductase
MMRAIRVQTPGGPEVLQGVELAVPAPAAGEVRVRLHAIGVNFADVMCRRATHRSMRPPPIVPGCEGAGIIDACGPEVDPRRLGERVGVYSPFGGAYAERIVVPAAYALPLPPTMGFEDAAAFTHLALTAHEALFGLGRAEAGMSVLVTAAAGGLGGMLRQLARVAGLHGIAAVGSAAKRTALLAAGEQTVLVYGDDDLGDAVLAATGGRGVDLVVDTVGGAVFAQSQRALAPLGRVVVAGAASGALAAPDMAGLLDRSASCATLNLSVVFAHAPERMRAAWERLTGFYDAGALNPQIGHRFALHEAAAAQYLLESRGSMGKILLNPAAGIAVPGTSLA